jgi:hypothetical protein
MNIILGFIPIPDCVSHPWPQIEFSPAHVP